MISLNRTENVLFGKKQVVSLKIFANLIEYCIDNFPRSTLYQSKTIKTFIYL